MVRAARILLCVQGVLGALTVLLVVATLVVLVLMWDTIIGTSRDPFDFVGGLADVGVLVLIVVVGGIALVLGTLALAVTIPAFVLAARFGSRRHTVRVGTLVFEAIVGGLGLLTGASRLVEGDITVGVIFLLVAATGWTAFGLLLSPRATTHFRTY